MLAVLSAVAIVAMVIAIAIDVFVRNITGASLPGMIEIAETSMVTAVAFGLAWAVSTVNTLPSHYTDRFNATWAKIINVFVWALATFYSVVVIRQYFEFYPVHQSREIRFGLVQWPMYPMRWVLTIGLSLAAGLTGQPVPVANQTRTNGLRRWLSRLADEALQDTAPSSTTYDAADNAEGEHNMTVGAVIAIV